ncbi:MULTISPECIES: thioredoxin family protein [unclassified Achromobacter]|jgi:thioredoxin 1|uniref:thioredoxin family protein n=1 Tax=unclassified Achromobacter TaxID=2626865 RepID=UPI000B517266|nr:MULTISPECIES: thioredoxin family protein [unclassified Achromobacter]OWT71361.1 thiol reductase thioredoxin [Achromobacter sp. HZ34]OWT73326.1 thiol reductase thioredoxin [Achromobacter sp. HZ28]
MSVPSTSTAPLPVPASLAFEPDDPTLSERLRQADIGLVACFCAAWCDTCREYRPKLDELAAQWPQFAFAWIDIEDHADLLGDEDVENFPTILVQIGGRSVFYGPMLPHIGHLERLLGTLDASSPAVATQLPDVRAMLDR